MAFWPMPACLPIRRRRISTPPEFQPSSLPGLTRQSITFERFISMDARVEPGHDEQIIEETTMATHKLLLLPGDGIGPEVMAEGKRLIDWLNAKGIASFETEQGLVGGSAYDAHKVSITDDTMAKAKA